MIQHVRTRVVLLTALCLTACGSCGAIEPPDAYSIEKMADPYDKIPAAGTVNNTERAIAAVDYTSKHLGYGDVPARVLRARGNEAWVRGLVLLLSSGTTGHLKLAWEGLTENVVREHNLPADLRFQVKQTEGRIFDYMGLKQPEDVMRRAYLAEIAWTLYLLSTVTPDAGVK